MYLSNLPKFTKKNCVINKHKLLAKKATDCIVNKMQIYVMNVILSTVQPNPGNAIVNM